MYDLRTIPALLALARDVLVNELMPLLPEERKIDAVLVAEAIALAASAVEAGDEPMHEAFRQLETLYHDTFTHPAITFRGKAGEGEATLLRRFANDLRNGAFETSGSRDHAARAILWQLTIGKLRQSNPNFLAANSFD